MDLFSISPSMIWGRGAIWFTLWAAREYRQRRIWSAPSEKLQAMAALGSASIQLARLSIFTGAKGLARKQACASA
jgi:hypothetical protein